MALEWFGNNWRMDNLGKIQHMLLGKQNPVKIIIEGFKLESAKSVTALELSL